MIKVAINGFGRIGRTAFRVAFEKYDDGLDIVAINDISDAKTLAHLLKYDSIYGIYEHDVTYDEGLLIVAGRKIKVFSEKDPSQLPWKDLDVDVVLECTGKFVSEEGASLHLKAGAKKVMISAPSKAGNVGTYLLGVNQDKIGKSEKIISNASCTTNCIGPVLTVIDSKFEIAKVVMTAIHSYTQDQNLQDGGHKDLRRARAAAQNIVPTTTGAAIATTEVIPKLKGLFDGIAVRVPTIDVSLNDFTILVKKKTTREEVNQTFREASQNPLYQGILAVCEEPLVSSDFIKNPYSAIVDLLLTQVIDGDLVKVFAWYDNEWGYSNRLVEMVFEYMK